MLDILQSKRKHVILTPFTERGRNLVAHVETWGLALRMKGKRRRLEISWAQILNRAAIVTADKLRAEKKAARAAKGK